MTRDARRPGPKDAGGGAGHALGGRLALGAKHALGGKHPLRGRHVEASAGEQPLRSGEAGLTLVELIITVAILAILASAAVPIARFEVKRRRERELRRDLWEMRDAIDRYKDAADRGGIKIKADSMGYPPDLQTLVDGVEVQDKKVRFLRAIPVDPMTKSTDWGLRSNQDDADADSWGGQNVFDVYTKSDDTALDGTKYKSW